MTENQNVDASDVQDASVDTGAQQPEEGGNSRQPQTEQNPPGPLEGDEQRAVDTGEDQSGDSTEQRTDASGRVLNPWESDPKGSRSSDEGSGESE